MKKYSVILADVPWSYQDSNAEITDSRRQVTKHYSVMSLEDIAALPVEQVAEDNCALFFWAVWPHIFDAKPIIESWGFTYRTIAWEWAKLNPSSIGFHMGIGQYTRSNTEPCLLAIRGSMPVAAKDVMSLIVSPVRQHSRKPDEQYGKIARLYPDTARLELFARRRWDETWDVWGNQIESTIELEVNDDGHQTED